MTETDMAVQETTLIIDGVFHINAPNKALVVIDLNGLQLAEDIPASPVYPPDEPCARLWLTSIDETVKSCLAKLQKKVNGIKYLVHGGDIAFEAIPRFGPFTKFEVVHDRLDSVAHIEGHRDDQDFTIIALVTDYRIRNDNDFWKAIEGDKPPQTAIKIQYSLLEDQIDVDATYLDKFYCSPPDVLVFESGPKAALRPNITPQPNVAAEAPNLDTLESVEDHKDAAGQIMKRREKKSKRVAGFVTFLEAATKAYSEI